MPDISRYSRSSQNRRRSSSVRYSTLCGARGIAGWPFSKSWTKVPRGSCAARGRRAGAIESKCFRRKCPTSRTYRFDDSMEPMELIESGSALMPLYSALADAGGIFHDSPQKRQLGGAAQKREREFRALQHVALISAREYERICFVRLERLLPTCKRCFERCESIVLGGADRALHQGGG